MGERAGAGTRPSPPLWSSLDVKNERMLLLEWTWKYRPIYVAGL